MSPDPTPTRRAHMTRSARPNPYARSWRRPLMTAGPRRSCGVASSAVPAPSRARYRADRWNPATRVTVSPPHKPALRGPGSLPSRPEEDDALPPAPCSWGAQYQPLGSANRTGAAAISGEYPGEAEHRAGRGLRRLLLLPAPSPRRPLPAATLERSCWWTSPIATGQGCCGRVLSLERRERCRQRRLWRCPNRTNAVLVSPG